MQRSIYVFIFIFSLLVIDFGYSQGTTQVEFGKNRVQYHQDYDEWSKYESDNFVTFWYGEGRFIGQAVVQLAEYDFNEIQSILEHRINEKIKIIVYTDVTDLKQSNIGTEEAFTNTGGQTKIVGNKVFVYFDGNHNNLRQQVREGIASVYLNAMLFGSNLQEIVQNAVMMNLPEWFKQGLLAYVGKNWDTGLDNQLRDYLLSEEFESFESFAEEHPKLAGHSLWHFISQNYGHSTVSNLLYLTRINRSIESGFLYVLGSSYGSITEGWELFYTQRYKAENAERNKPEKRRIKFKNKRNLPVSQLKISPDGKKVVYVTNEIGKYKVYLQDLRSGDREVIHSGGFRNAFQTTDYNYPLISWNPSGLEVAVMYERRDVVKLMMYDIHTKKSVVEDMSTQYQRVHSMDFVNSFTMVLSGTVRGFSDIFLYYTKTRQSERITQDFYDDLDAAFVNVDGRKGILFASNRENLKINTIRLDSILPINTFDLFYYDLDTKSKELVRVTNTPLANERQPVAVDSMYFSYLSDRSGLYNREAGYLEEYLDHYDQYITLNDGTEIVMHADSSLEKLDTTAIDTIVIRPVIKKRAIIHTNSNYQRNIIEQATAPRANRLAELVFRDGEYQAYYGEIQIDTVITPPLSFYQRSRIAFYETSNQGMTNTGDEEPNRTVLDEVVPPEIVEELPVPAAKPDTGKVDIDNYLFQSEFDEEEVPAKVIVEEVEEETPAEEVEEEGVVDEAPTEKIRVITEANQKVTSESNTGSDGQSVYNFRPGRIVPYRLTFRTDYVTTQLDNSLLFDGLQSYAADPNGFNYPAPGILLKANFKDLFEDYEIEGGVRIPTTFNGTEYFLIYDDKKKRLDKRYAIYRKNSRDSQESTSFVPNRREINILLGQFGVRYPLDIFRSVRGTFTLRRDRTTQLATEKPTLETATESQERMALKLEYVFDNTLDVAMNIKNGTRYKVFGEVVKRFDLEVFDGFNLSFNEGFMTVLGFDARHYQRIDKNSILAVRLAGVTSFGSEKTLFYLGGVDNWLFTSFNDEIPIPQNGNFAYQTVATNMRGFRINIRNGNSFGLLNTELRVPIFKYFSKRIRSSFFRNFQIVGFFDLGTAWEGSNPFSKENPLNTSTITRGELVEVEVQYFRDPIVAGYGVGIRSVLFGYFVRLDYAWGIETRIVQDPRLYISLGMDF